MFQYVWQSKWPNIASSKNIFEHHLENKIVLPYSIKNPLILKFYYNKYNINY